MGKLNEIIGNINSITSGRYSMAGQYVGYDKPINLHCNIHNVDFEIIANRLLELYDYPNKIFIACPGCVEERRSKNKVIVHCAYCGKELVRSKSWSYGNSSGLAFCSVDHKHKAQSIEFGLTEIQPPHYGRRNDYRTMAFNQYEHRCAVCGYSEDVRILDVHHRDMDRSNNETSNLVILCPNCHTKITRGYKMLVANKLLDCTEGYIKQFRRKQSHKHTRSGNSQPVKVVEDNLEFKSICECSRHYGISDATVHSALRDNDGHVALLNKTILRI